MRDNGIHLTGLSSSIAKVKFATAKQLVELAKTHPETLYPAFDSIVPILDDHNNILKWCATDAIGYLACADDRHLIDTLLPRLFRMLRNGKLITANHAVAALGRIANARPELRHAITGELLKVERYTFETSECRNIVIGKTLEAFSEYAHEDRENPKIVSFAERQLRNTRPATRKKAERLLKKLVVEA